MPRAAQIALFALPLCVVVGWATGHAFTLNLDPFMALVRPCGGVGGFCSVTGRAPAHSQPPTAPPPTHKHTQVLTISVLHGTIITNDATSNWLMGVQLVGVYVIIAAAYYVSGERGGESEGGAGDAVGAVCVRKMTRDAAR